ncbi:hypothetical protein RI129_007390 [Pyrocoelia pectoralis]|uniref:Uncharacterized protein n=1 Tax=Pyrocoelia pectoralis TaxID=417401 RepID=A0AAN7V7Y1_9COLE
MSKQIIKFINDTNIVLNKCRGQGHDGGNNMKGSYGGVQKLIRDIEPNAVYVHLNGVIFFETLQQIYKFFGQSIKRWNILSSFINIKNISPTRWAGRYDAIFALNVRFVEVQKALTKTSLLNSKADERNETILLKKKVENYNFIILLVFHCKILQTIDAASKALQSKAIDLSNASKRLQVCLEDLEKYRNEFENLKTQANSRYIKKMIYQPRIS